MSQNTAQFIWNLLVRFTHGAYPIKFLIIIEIDLLGRMTHLSSVILVDTHLPPCGLIEEYAARKLAQRCIHGVFLL